MRIGAQKYNFYLKFTENDLSLKIFTLRKVNCLFTSIDFLS